MPKLDPVPPQLGTVRILTQTEVEGGILKAGPSNSNSPELSTLGTGLGKKGPSLLGQQSPWDEGLSGRVASYPAGKAVTLGP